METLIEATQVKGRKTRNDVKLTKERFTTIENCLKLRMIQDDIVRITGVNKATISAVKLVLAYLGRL